jgi:glycosyltransferase involved in cell wall biosynthesis|tara:strand:- start:212 stop:940 length:729 start_codon:yes stop_codon:yes gene_type:complete
MNNLQKKLSIITVTKDCRATLERTLLSVQKIKTEDIEYIIIDGVSTDGTLDLIKQYGDLIDHCISEPDTGIYNAMNKGVSRANGTYILFINGDDELISDGFPEVLAHIDAEKSDIICAATLVGSEQSPIEKLVAKPLRLLFFNSIPHPSSFVKTQLLKKIPFRENLKIAADYHFFLGAYLKRQKFTIIKSATALHQRGGASGDVIQSNIEIEAIKSYHLGVLYPIITLLSKTYRFTKKLINK